MRQKLRVYLGEEVEQLMNKLHRLYRLRDGSQDIEDAIRKTERELREAIDNFVDEANNGKPR